MFVCENLLFLLSVNIVHSCELSIPKETLSGNQSVPGRAIVIPKKFEKLVKGPDGDHLQHVSTMTGAAVSSIGPDHRLYVSGSKRNTNHAEYVIKSRMVSLTLTLFHVKENKILDTLPNAKCLLFLIQRGAFFSVRSTVFSALTVNPYFFALF